MNSDGGVVRYLVDVMKKENEDDNKYLEIWDETFGG